MFANLPKKQIGKMAKHSLKIKHLDAKSLCCVEKIIYINFDEEIRRVIWIFLWKITSNNVTTHPHKWSSPMEFEYKNQHVKHYMCPIICQKRISQLSSHKTPFWRHLTDLKKNLTWLLRSMMEKLSLSW